MQGVKAAHGGAPEGLVPQRPQPLETAEKWLQRFRMEGCPKDPPILKILRRVNFGMGTKFATAMAKRYGECSEMLVFLGKKKEENGTYSGKLWR